MTLSKRGDKRVQLECRLLSCPCYSSSKYKILFIKEICEFLDFTSMTETRTTMVHYMFNVMDCSVVQTACFVLYSHFQQTAGHFHRFKHQSKLQIDTGKYRHWWFLSKIENSVTTHLFRTLWRCGLLWKCCHSYELSRLSDPYYAARTIRFTEIIESPTTS